MPNTTYDRLLAKSQAGEIVFRIWCESGDSPLIPHRYPSRSGFFAKHTFARQMDEDDYRDTCGDLSLEVKDKDTWVRYSVLEHVRGPGDWLFNKRAIRDAPPHLAKPARPLRCARTGGNNQDLLLDFGDDNEEKKEDTTSSPWIVTHGKLDWVIHRIIKLLSRDYGARYHMTVIHIGEDTVERRTQSADHLKLLKQHAKWGQAERKLVNEAYNFAKRSEEVLFYGRIFGGSVKEDFLWSNDHLPFSLPNWFWKGNARILLRSWMDNLIWVPYQTPYTLVEIWRKDGKEKEERKRKVSLIDWCEEINRA